jgi:hypothetical protein
MDYDDAYFEYINGQNDAIDLMPPQSNNKCYLEGWHDAKRRLASLDKYCPGWTWEIKETLISSDRIFMVGRLTIPTLEGNIYREASGTEELKREKYNKDTGEYQALELAYGDPSSNAESMAFRRCAARFGLGLYLYQKK